MSLASLAAYASSDEESDAEPDESTSTSGPSSSVPPLTSPADVIEDEDDYHMTSRTVTSSLPMANENEKSDTGSIFQADDVVDDVPLAEKIHAEKPKKSGKVKISVPSLSQFKDDDEEPAAKKMKPSVKGSGLFSLLPPPKTQSTKQTGRALLPQAVSRPAPPRRPAPAPARAPTRTPLVDAAPDSDEEEPAQPGGGDFFSLTEAPRPAAVPTAAVGPLTFIERAQAAESGPVAGGSAGPPDAQPVPMDTGEREPAAAWPASRQQLDPQALQRLRGRRGRREEADIHIIDVNQDDIMPDRDEWMTKALTEETVVRRPQKSADDPTMQQRRKHQITYLAHQAKEREVELKNEWATNRATKNAYRTKYGF